jgi:tetratricopeptide (TPR) repeat protein
MRQHPGDHIQSGTSAESAAISEPLSDGVERLGEAETCTTRLGPDDVDARFNLGTLLQEQGKLAEAIAAYRSIIRVKPGLAIVHANLGSALQKSGALGEAILAYRDALRIDANLVEVHSNLGTIFHLQGKLNKAASCYREAIRPPCQ